jgi:uncharacterized protein (DUF983 family)
MAIDAVDLPISSLAASSLAAGKAYTEDDLGRPKRNTWRAIRRGFSGHCPACGTGALFGKYLKVNDRCPVCAAELFHQRADDAPPYLTILVVGHIVGILMLTTDTLFPDFPLLYQSILWSTLTVGLSLLLLPAFKGGLIGYQWALRMHGFDSAPDASSAGADSLG